MSKKDKQPKEESKVTSEPKSVAGDVKSSDEAVDIDQIKPQVEAVLMTVDRPITTGKIAEAVAITSSKPITAAIKVLNQDYKKTGRSFRIEQVAGGFQILTLPEFKEQLASLYKTRIDNKLSPVAMETLAIIAYKQPILRAEIESIRGVACGEMVRSLMDKHLVKIVGRADEIGRPMLYGTTKRFLEIFGLSNLKDMPKVEELIQP